ADAGSALARRRTPLWRRPFPWHAHRCYSSGSPGMARRRRAAEQGKQGSAKGADQAIMTTLQSLRADLGIAERFLRVTEESPALEIIQVKGKGEHAYPPIVCLHGASSGAWMWEEFLRVLDARGRRAAALSLRGHGRSDGRDELKSATLDDYAQDVLRAFSEFVEPPILFSHSLGSLIAGRFFGRLAMRAICVLGSFAPGRSCS